jgi:hypothetical protein
LKNTTITKMQVLSLWMQLSGLAPGTTARLS